MAVAEVAGLATELKELLHWLGQLMAVVGVAERTAGLSEVSHRLGQQMLLAVVTFSAAVL